MFNPYTYLNVVIKGTISFEEFQGALGMDGTTGHLTTGMVSRTNGIGGSTLLNYGISKLVNCGL